MASPVKRAATELGIAVTDAVDDVIAVGAELGVVVAFGRLIKPHVLARLSFVNLHFSLLPRWRGAAPVERAILAGDSETGVCLMALEQGLDTGPVYARETVTIGAEETAAQLTGRLVEVGTKMLVSTLGQGVGGLPEPQPQQGEPTYASKLEPEELRLDWSRPAEELHRVVRVGRAWTTFRGRRLLVLAARVASVPGGRGPGSIDGVTAATGEGALELLEVQPEGRGAIRAGDWVNGARISPGETLGG